MLLKKKSAPKLQSITCTIIGIQELPSGIEINFGRNLNLFIPYSEEGYSRLCKLGYLAGLRGSFNVSELLGCKVSVNIFNNEITKITK